MSATHSPRNEDERNALLAIPGVKLERDGTVLIPVMALATAFNVIEFGSSGIPTVPAPLPRKAAPFIRPGQAAAAKDRR